MLHALHNGRALPLRSIKTQAAHDAESACGGAKLAKWQCMMLGRRRVC